MNQTTRNELSTPALFCREALCEYTGCETAAENGGFAACLSFRTEKNMLAFDVIRIRSDASGETDAARLDAAASVADGLGCLTLAGLPLLKENEGLELVVRPYETVDGLRRYGRSVRLGTVGTKDAALPTLSEKKGERVRIGATDDTYVFNMEGQTTADFGSETRFPLRNPGDENTDLFRAAYFKFTLDKNAVAALANAASAKLGVYTGGPENNPERKLYDMTVHAAGTDWDEHTLNFGNHATRAATGEQLFRGRLYAGRYLTAELLPFLKKQTPNADGSLTVAFRLTTEGHPDALLSNWYSKESDKPPYIEIADSHFETALDLGQAKNEGFEPWGYAESIVNAWFDDLRDKVYPRDAEGNLVYYNEFGDLTPHGYGATEPTGDFVCDLKWKNGTVWSPKAEDGYRVKEDEWEKAHFVRTLQTLGTSAGKPYLASKQATRATAYDAWGGIQNAGFRGKATGFFHTETHGKRAYIIDPEGNPYFAQGFNTVCLGDNENHKTYSRARFGSEENYYREITKSLKEVGINNTWVSPATNELLKVEKGLSVVVTAVGASRYMHVLGRSHLWEGMLPLNNTMNVFDPDFVRHAYRENEKLIREGGYADMPNVLGYIADNELPSGYIIFERYLTLNPTDPVAAFSYATARAFLARKLGKPNASLADLHRVPNYAAINSEFMAFLYSRYYGTVRDAIRAVDKNHMYLGARGCYTCLTDEGHHRAAGYYLDVITANLYGGLNPDAKTISNFYRYSGKPFMVTEFFAKATDAIDANGYKLANSTGAGILVERQADRAAYYQHYALALLESGACVGLVWYRFRDNDQTLYREKATGDILYMLHMIYGGNTHATTYTDAKGRIRPAAEVGELEEIYHGEPMASNQNVNKGIFNSDLSSVVTLYTYGADGKLIDSMGYRVEDPDAPHLPEGTTLTALDGTRSFTLGRVPRADGGYVETILTAYKGRYVALADAISEISNHLIGLVEYFDEK